MRAFSKGLIVAMATTWAACGAGDEPAGKRVAISTAPLTLPNIDDACYTLEVRNDLGETVWREEHVCATQYGDAIGSITYIGPCDAQDNDQSGDALNTITLTLENLYTSAHDPADYSAGAVADDEWDNPCSVYADGSEVDPNGDGQPVCQLSFDCLENEDVLVEFNVTIMRDANQGFFDIAVNFDDIFCSAKVDCIDAEGEQLDLLFNGGERDSTAVMAFACTAGEDADTHMYLSDTYIVCDHNSVNGSVTAPERTGVVAQLSPSSGPGNAGSPTAGIFEHAVYNGREQLGDYNKQYSNMAIGIDDAFFQHDFFGTPVTRACWLVAWATASDGVWPGSQSPLATTYPIVRYMVPLNPPATQGGPPATTLSCGAHPLDGDGSGVKTAYDASAIETCYENVVDGHWEDPSGDVETSHYIQFQYNDGLQWHPWRLNDGAAALESWRDTGAPMISDCEVNWDRTNQQIGTSSYAPIDYDAGEQSFQVTICRDDSPENGQCDVGEATFAGIPFRATTSFLLFDGQPGGSVWYEATTDANGVATFSGVDPANLSLNIAPGFLMNSATLCDVPGEVYYYPSSGWPAMFAAGGPDDVEAFEFTFTCN